MLTMKQAYKNFHITTKSSKARLNSYYSSACTLHYYYTCIIPFAGATHLRGVLRYLKKENVVTYWRMIGIELELTYSDLDIIEQNRDTLADRVAAMLNQWLTSGRATKQALMEAVQEVK